MGLALENNQQRLLSLGLGALAALCTAYGINDLQRFEPDLDAAVAQAYQAGDDNKQTVLTESRKAKMDGMGALVLGAALGIAGWLTSSHEKNDVSPTESARVQPSTVELDLPNIPRQQLRADLVGQLENAISNDKSHVQILKAETIIISGVTGSGKSSIANAIATERKLLLDHEVIVLDPDLQYNLDRWAVGEGYGQPERIAQFLDLITTGKGKGKPITFICDEWSKWGHPGEGMEVLQGIASKLPTLAKQALRKREVSVVFITHGLSKDDVCPFAPDGTYTQLMKEAVVIEPLGRQNTKLTAKYATTPTGFGMVSFKGQAPTKRKKIAFCPLWLPGVVQQHLGQYLKHLRIAFDANPIGIKLDPEVTDLIARKMSALEENRDKFDRLMHGFDATEHPVEKPISIEWPDGSLELLDYLFGRGQKNADDQGFFLVRIIQQNWAKNRGYSSDQLKELLIEMVAKNLGCFSDDEQRLWKPIVNPDILP